MLIPTQNPTAKTRNANSLRTHCQNGHPFDEINTYIQPKYKGRLCRICESARKKRVYNEDPEGSKAYNRVHMQRWRAANRERDRRNWTELRKRKKEWLDQQKTFCNRCGESDIVCLDFHHTDPTLKDANLSIAVSHWSIKRLQKEIDKCEIICSNCHRKLHAQERNSQEGI